jgi:hypothetical protein
MNFEEREEKKGFYSHDGDYGEYHLSEYDTV